MVDVVTTMTGSANLAAVPGGNPCGGTGVIFAGGRILRAPSRYVHRDPAAWPEWGTDDGGQAMGACRLPLTVFGESF